MKVAVLVLAALAVAHATVVHTKAPRKVADTEFLTKQKQILRLLIGLGHEETFTSEHDNYDIAANADHYADPKYVNDFLYVYKHGFLPKNSYFTMNCKKTRYQTIKLFDLFYFAKDYETFYKTAAWARTHINGAQFAYAFYVAVYHRPDLHGITLPSLYEVFPNAFVPSYLLHEVHDAKMEGHDEYHVYVNNSGWQDYYHRSMFEGPMSPGWGTPFKNTEERLSYFREDVGLNDFFAQFFALYPSWLNEEKYGAVSYFRRGEVFYYFLQQLYARYALERLANAMPVTDLLFWDKPIRVGYNPNLQTFNGHALFPRADFMTPYDYNPKMVYRADTFERRIIDMIDFRRIFFQNNKTWTDISNVDGIDWLGKMFWSTPDSPGPYYYGSYFYKAMNAIGYMVKTASDREYVPGAMGQMVTAPRDPAFYTLLHRFVKIFQHHKKFMPTYTHNELEFPGVKVTSFEVDKLWTFFDRYSFEVTNAVPVVVGGQKTYKDYHYVAKQYRLNHKPFTYKLTVTSDKASDAIVRVFIGPKYDSEGREMTLDQARMAYVEFDRFPVKLTNGQNVFERNSRESPAYVEDNESLRTFYNRVSDSIEKKEPFYVTDSFRCGMPERFILPKGWKQGHPYVMFAIVSPYEHKYEPKTEERYFDDYILCGGSKYYDHRPFGFPFDRPVEFDEDLHIPNAYFKDVLVYHKDEADINRVA